MSDEDWWIIAGLITAMALLFALLLLDHYVLLI
jgi:hypothetical protein